MGSTNLRAELIDVTASSPPSLQGAVYRPDLTFRSLTVGRLPAGCNFKLALGAGGGQLVPVEQGMVIAVEGSEPVRGLAWTWTTVAAGGPDGNFAILYLADGVTVMSPARTSIPG